MPSNHISLFGNRQPNFYYSSKLQKRGFFCVKCLIHLLLFCSMFTISHLRHQHRSTKFTIGFVLETECVDGTRQHCERMKQLIMQQQYQLALIFQFWTNACTLFQPRSMMHLWFHTNMKRITKINHSISLIIDDRLKKRDKADVKHVYRVETMVLVVTVSSDEHHNLQWINSKHFDYGKQQKKDFVGPSL